MLEKAKLTNFCRHEQLDISFPAGLSAILGPNGSGKSTILVALAGAFTGSFNAPGAKNTNVRNNAAEDVKSSVAVELTLAGKPATLIRSLKPGGQRLKHDEQVYTKDSAIQDRLTALLGMSPEAFVEFAFAFQGDIFDILTVPASKRMQALGRLFRLDKLECAWSALGERISSLSMPVLPFDEETVRNQLQADEESLLSVVGELDQLGEHDEQRENELRKQVVAFERSLLLSKEEDALAVKSADLAERCDKIDKALAATEEDLAELKKGYSPQQVAAYLAALNAWSAFDKQLAQKNAAQERLDRLEKEQAARQAPDGDLTWTEEDENKLTGLAVDLRQVEQFLKTFNPATGLAACPTCGTDTAVLAQKVAAQRSSQQILKMMVDGLRADKANYAKQEAARKEYQSWLAGSQTRLALARRDAEVELQQPETDRDELARLLREAKEVDTAVKQLDMERNTLLASQSKHRAEYQAACQKFQEVQAELAGAPTAEEAESARTDLFRLQEQQRQRYQLAARRDALLVSIDTATKQLDSLEPVKEKLARLNSWKSCMTNVRAAFHRDAMQKEIAREYLRKLEVGVNRYLDELGVDYRVSVDDNVFFQVEFPDGRRVPADRLSWGEKTLLAIAWRLNVNATFAGDIGLLCLDEPTAGLDGERLGSLRRALERLRTMSGATGLQCIIVTHERSLMPLFDHVIELKSTT